MGNDLNIFPTIEGEVALDFDNSGGTFATGTALVAQRFVTYLLTQLGSVLHTLDFGTDFVYDAKTGKLRNEAELQLAFALAVTDMTDYQDEMVDTTDPDEEIPLSELFATAELEDFSYAEDRLILDIIVITQDEDAVKLQMPIVVVET